ncbi:MAG: NAD(P)H-dependent oxidoreductase subunit E, partial [Anaerolineales bacterium]
DLQAGQVDRAALFWLKVFVQEALAAGGELRSDRWIEAGLAAAQGVPGLVATLPTPRQQLVARYDLFQFIRLKDDAQLSGVSLADLDWQRKYRVGLLPPFASDLPELETWAADLWAELGGVAPEFAALEEVLARYRLPGPAALIEVLHECQAIFGGWLPREVVERVAVVLNIPLADIYGVTEFYEMLYTQPVGHQIVRVCQDAPCALAGADRLTSKLCQQLGVEPGQTTPDGQYTLEAVRCLGLCDRAPAALVNLERYAPLDPADPATDLKKPPPQQSLAIGGLVKLALSNVGVVDPTRLEDYVAQGGLAALRQAFRDMTPAQVLEEVKASKLVGRGGAAFPTGVKWEFAVRNPGPRYVICNADESEPGAFKDRVLMDGDPFRVVEGLILACYAVGAQQGFIYVRGEHRLGYERFTGAIRQLAAAGYLGADISGSGFDCQIEVRRGAGAYVCGEETALMESIEGKRGFPRLRPPFPTDSGLWAQPTVINNVETLAKVPPIILHGARWYNALGTPESAGTKLFAVSGSVLRPGVYEVPFGVRLRHLIYDLAGGLPAGHQLQAILTGGAAGTFLTAQHLDTPLTFEDFRKVGGTIGAGTIMVFDDRVDLRQVLRRIGDFFAHESCGKCYPCQMGSQRQAEILERIANGQARPDDFQALLELGTVMTDTSICGLGQTASMAVINAHQHWPELFAAS